jgi:hypothetical protein
MTAESWRNWPRNLFVTRQRLINIFLWQLKHTPALTIPGPLLGKSLLNSLLNNGGILGIGVFCVVCAEVI